MKKAPNLHRIAQKERWVSVLRGQLLLHGVRAPELVEEHVFLTNRRFRFDFALPELRIGIEVEGGIFIHNPRPGHKSRHTSGAGYEKDCEKYNLAAIAGWTVLRFVSPVIVRGEAVHVILSAIAARRTAIA